MKLLKHFFFISSIFLILVSCETNELDCFETPPSFCNARRQFISFEVDEIRYRFCQSEFEETFDKEQAPFFLINQYVEFENRGTVQASFIIPNLFAFQLHLPASNSDYPLGNLNETLPLNFTSENNDLFTGTLLFTRECDIEYASFQPPVDPNNNFHQITSLELVRTFTEGDSTITEYRIQGTFQGKLNGYPENKETIQLDNGKYDLLLWHVE